MKFDLKLTTSIAIRLALLMTHYRKPLELGKPTEGQYPKVEEARKMLRRFYIACEPSYDGPPLELIQALENDLNTPAAIALLHKYRKNNGRKLFASLRFLGLVEGLYPSEVHELKTLPDDHEWAQPVYFGPDTPVPEYTI